MKCVKYVLFAFNLIFFLAGLGLIIAGTVVQTRFSTYFDFFGQSFSAAAILLIVVGSIIFIIGFFGCCGAYKENYCMTMTFAVLLGIVFVLEIAAAITAYVMRNEVHGFVEDSLREAMLEYGDVEHEGVTKAWDVAQHDFACCGVNNYTDWQNHVNLTDNSVPNSCCIDYEENDENPDTKDCGKGMVTNPDAKNFIHTQGCIFGFEDWVKENIYIIGGVGIGLAFVQVIGIIFSCCLARTIRKEYEVV